MEGPVGLGIDSNHKLCFKCEKILPKVDFHRHSGMSAGILNKCKYCVATAVSQWRAAGNRDSAKESRKYTEKYPAKRAAQKRKIHVKRELAMQTQWTEFDNLFFEEIYDLAKLREKATGFKWHVDHIIPLQNKNVCGLHVPENLQCIPAKLNLIKGNSFNGTPRHWIK